MSMTKMMGPLVAAAVVMALGSGCAAYNTRIKTGLPPGGEVKEQGAKFYVYGHVGEQDVELQTLCPSGVASVQTRFGVADQLLTVFTLGIYSPMTVVVECAGGTAYLLTPDDETGLTDVQPVAG